MAHIEIAPRDVRFRGVKASRLCEQEGEAVSAATALEMYVRRWLRWAKRGMGGYDG